MRNVYIVASQRTAVTKAHRGAFSKTRPDDLLAFIIKETVKKSNINVNDVEDVIIGCAMPESAQGMNVARISALLAGLPDTAPGITVNRFCCSGVESVALLAQRIQSGAIECGVAGGVESMTTVALGGENYSANPKYYEKDENIAIAYGMGITAEKVAEQYNVSRQEQDEFAVESHRRAANAIKNGYFKDEIIPFPVKSYQADLKNNKVVEKDFLVDTDEGVRANSNVETLNKLRTVFKNKGTVTAANSSQVSDGAGCVVLVSEEYLKKHNLTPIARFIDYQVAGVKPEIMGIGPVAAIPKALKKANLKISDIGWIELNEAFAAQSVAIIKDLGLDTSKVNPNGGAIALGHPLGATGAIRLATAIHNCKRVGEKYAMVTMCIGTGMGACGIFEVL